MISQCYPVAICVNCLLSTVVYGFINQHQLLVNLYYKALALALFKDQRTVVRLTADIEQHLFTTPNIPLSGNVELVSLSLIGNDYYLASKIFTTAGNDFIQLAPEKKSEDEVKNFLNAL